MKFTTVCILVIGVVGCCNAQSSFTKEQLRVVTSIRNDSASPKYFNIDENAAYIRLKPTASIHSLVTLGVSVVKKIDDQTYVVRPQRLALAKLSENIEQRTPVNYLWKLSPNLLALNAEHGEYIIKTSNTAATASLMRSNKVSLRQQGSLLIATGEFHTILTSILTDENVTYVGKESFSASEEGRVLDLYLGPNQINKVHHEFPELNGTGIVVSMKESHYQVADIDLLGRHLPSTLGASDSSNHATEMATIVAGAGNSFVTGRGVADHATITSSSFSNLFPDSDADFNSLNVRLQNHSYGTTVENFYGALASAYDESANRNPTVLHVFSSGNSGSANATSGAYVAAPGFSNLTGNSKMAKNILVVGAVDTTGNEIPFASRGPAHDGRIKPELVAYSSAGTSNAAALVSGTVALLQQAYKEKHGAYPESALMKAILINAAADVGAPGIDFSTGYGNLNAYRSLVNLQQELYFEGVLSSNETRTYDLEIPSEAKNLKITLVWNDPAADPNSEKALVNNLNLELSTADAIVLPWILNTAPTVSSLKSPAIRGVDDLNNVEQITIEEPSAATYTITVTAPALAGAQKFFVAYQWDVVNDFQWDFPTGSDNFPYNGETGTYFYWHSTLALPLGTLDVSLDNGLTWKPIVQDVDLKKGYHRWQEPFMVNATAIARMVVGGEIFETEPFTISRTLQPSVGFNCGDSALLVWDRGENVSQYEIRKLTGEFTSTISIQSDTSLVVNTKEGVNYLVVPIVGDGKKLLRSPMINVETFGAGCYIATFGDESIAEDGIVLRLELGTTYGVREVVFEHAQGDAFSPFISVEPYDENVLRVLHKDPVQGLNRYRARVRLTNGQELLTDTIQNYFLTKIPFIVFPNPVKASQDVNVFSGKFQPVDFDFHLFKSDGTLIRSATLSSDRDFINTDGLIPGLYLYRIQGAEGQFSGKIVIE